METMQAPRRRASGSGPSSRPIGVLWLDIAAARGVEEHVILKNQKWFLFQTSPIKQNKRYWASVSHRVIMTRKEQGGGGRRKRRLCCLFGIISSENISGVYGFVEVDQDKKPIAHSDGIFSTEFRKPTSRGKYDTALAPHVQFYMKVRRTHV